MIERAYVDMSPKKGLPILAVGKVPKVLIGIANYGSTPADVVAVALIGRITIQPLPDRFPDIPPRENVRFFIQPGGKDSAVVWSPDYNITDPLSHAEVSALADKNDPLKFWIIGYVDYIDRFQERHRHRFTRKYVPPKDPLAANDETNYFVVESKPGYNGEQ